MIKWIIFATLVVFLLPDSVFAKNAAAHLAPLDIHWDTQRSLPAMVRMSGDQIEWDSNDAIRKSYQFLNVYKDLYGITEAENDLRLIDTEEDNLGMSHVTLQQVIGSVPVYGSYLKTHFRNDGALSSVNGSYVSDFTNLDLKPDISKSQAVRLAKEHLQTELKLDPSFLDEINITTQAAELAIYDIALFSHQISNPSLSWKIVLTAQNVILEYQYFIDANDGSVINSYSLLTHARNRSTYVLSDCEDESGTLTYDEAGLVGSYDSDAGWVHLYAGYAYDYFYDKFGRDSFDDIDSDDSSDGGGTINSYTHYEDVGTLFCEDEFNAFWRYSNSSMYFARGVYSQDIVGHEFTHGVIDAAAGLDRTGQPLALHESYADIFGMLIEAYSGETDWIIGEDLTSNRSDECSQGLRDLSNPGSLTAHCDGGGDADPDHINDLGGDYSDQYAVSIIVSHAFYLLTEGGTHAESGNEVTGIGDLDIVGEIYYRALTTYLTVDAELTDAYNATMQACLDLNASDSTTYPISYCESVFDAFAAVGINTDSSYAWANISASSTSGTAPLAITFDGADSMTINSTIDIYAWDFGDGSTDSGGAVSHTFSNPGTYTVTLTVTDSNGYTNTATEDILVYVSGTISSNTTWSADYSPYVISGNVTVSSGYTLTIEPGTVIKFYDATSSLTVNGTLDAQGTATDQIVFTSYYDDDYGGDTNGDGTATTPAAGDWEMLAFASGSTATVGYTTIQYGGYDDGSGGVWDGAMVFVDSNATNISIDHSTLQESQFPTVRTDTGSTTSISNSNILNSTSSSTSYQDAVYVADGTVTLTDNVITADSSRGFGVYTDAGEPSITGNTISGYYGIYLSSASTPSTVSSNTISGTGVGYEYGILNAAPSLTISSNVISNTYYGIGSYGVAEIISDNTITGTYIGIMNSDPSVTIGNNTLTNIDWGIYNTGSGTIDSNSITTVQHGIYNTSSAIAITGNVVSDASYGIKDAYGGAATITSNTITGSAFGIYVTSSASPTISSNLISENSYGLLYNSSATASSVLSNNLIYNNIAYGLSNSSGSTLTAESNWWGDASGPYHATSNPTGTGDTVSGYVDFDPWLASDPTADTTSPSDATLGTTSKDVWAQTITLNWTNPTDSDFDHVQIDQTNVTTGTTTTLSSSETGTSYTDTTPAYNITYTYTLYACDTSGNCSTGVTTSNQRLRNPTPTNLTLTAGDITIAATWNASSAPTTTLGGYMVYYGTSRTALTNSIDVGNTTSTTITGLTNGTRYFIAVSAYSTGGDESTQSSIRATRSHP